MAFLSNKKAEENTVAADSTPNGLQEAAMRQLCRIQTVMCSYLRFSSYKAIAAAVDTFRLSTCGDIGSLTDESQFS